MQNDLRYHRHAGPVSFQAGQSCLTCWIDGRTLQLLALQQPHCCQGRDTQHVQAAMSCWLGSTAYRSKPPPRNRMIESAAVEGHADTFQRVKNEWMSTLTSTHPSTSNVTHPFPSSLAGCLSRRSWAAPQEAMMVAGLNHGQDLGHERQTSQSSQHLRCVDLEHMPGALGHSIPPACRLGRGLVSGGCHASQSPSSAVISCRMLCTGLHANQRTMEPHQSCELSWQEATAGAPAQP